MKRSFLLLEVLLAIAVVALFAAPLMRWPIKHYQSQINRLEEFEYQRIADWTFSIKELLLKEGIAWSKLPTKGHTLTRPLSDVKRFIPQLPDRSVRRSFSLKCNGEKKGTHGEIFRIYYIEITMDSNKSYQYRILVQRLAS
jgi:hypothetical protein